MPSKQLRPAFKNRKPKTYDVLLGLNEVYMDKPIFTDVYVAKQLQFTVLSVIQFEDHDPQISNSIEQRCTSQLKHVFRLEENISCVMSQNSLAP